MGETLTNPCKCCKYGEQDWGEQPCRSCCEHDEWVPTDLFASAPETAAERNKLRNELAMSQDDYAMANTKRKEAEAERDRLRALVGEMVEHIETLLLERRNIDEALNQPPHSVIGWHLNGDPEPVSTFFEENVEPDVEENTSALLAKVAAEREAREGQLLIRHDGRMVSELPKASGEITDAGLHRNATVEPTSRHVFEPHVAVEQVCGICGMPEQNVLHVQGERRAER